VDDRSEFQRRLGVGERQHPYGRRVGTDKRVNVIREDDGRVGGYHTHHWDGSVSATVRPDPIRKVGNTRSPVGG
jgi:hypothetical protein